MFIFIRGLPRSGKTSISNLLGEKLGMQKIHVDDFKKELMDRNPKALFIQEVVPYSYKRTLENLEQHKKSDLIIEEIFRNKEFVKDVINFCTINKISYQWFTIERDWQELLSANENRKGNVKNTPESLERMRQEISGIKIEGEIAIKNSSVDGATEAMMVYLKKFFHSSIEVE